MMISANSLFVDTSGWAGYINQQDPAHADITTLLDQALASKRKLVATNYIFAELVPLATARFRLTRPQIFAIIETIKALPLLAIIHIDPALDTEAWNLLKARPDKEWSLVDAASFVVMRQQHIAEALTTDHHFLQAGFTRVPQQ